MASAIQTIKDITVGKDITATTTINNNIANQTNNIVAYARTKIQGTASDC